MSTCPGLEQSLQGEQAMDQGIINLYDHFTHGTMARREFLDRLGPHAGVPRAALGTPPKAA